MRELFLIECARWRRAAMFETLRWRPSGRPASVSFTR